MNTPRTPCPTDLETLVTALEISAICLTPTVDSVFTREQLLDGAVDLMPELNRGDLELVLNHYPTLTRAVPGGLVMR